MNARNVITAHVQTAPADAKVLSQLVGLSESRTSEVCRELVKSGHLLATKNGRSFIYSSPTPVPPASAEVVAALAPIEPALPKAETPKQAAAAVELVEIAKANPKRMRKIVAEVDKAKAKKTVAKLQKRTLADDLLDTTPAKKAVLKKASGGKRVRSCNGTQARLDALKVYVKEHGGWTMSWTGHGRLWSFKSKGKEAKTLLSTELAEHTEQSLAKWLSK